MWIILHRTSGAECGSGRGWRSVADAGTSEIRNDMMTGPSDEPSQNVILSEAPRRGAESKDLCGRAKYEIRNGSQLSHRHQHALCTPVLDLFDLEAQPIPLGHGAFDGVTIDQVSDQPADRIDILGL